jgi:type IX secretion system PorP/SprF family membrane protein
MIKKIEILIILFIIPVFLVGQEQKQEVNYKIGQRYEPVYSQYWVNGLAINPAYAGSRECFSNIILYRNQWMGFPGAPITQTLSSHLPFKDEKNAVGLFLFGETIGVTDYYDIYGNYAFRFNVGSGRLSLGLKAGVTLFQGNYSDLTTDPEGMVTTDDALNNESEVFPNFGVGAYYYSDRFYFGISVPKLLSYELINSEKQMSIGPDNYDFLVTGGVLIGKSETLKFKPSFLFRYRLDNTYQIDIGGNFIIYDQFWIGGSYRYNDEIVFMVEYQMSDQIRAGVAYDIAVSDFASQHSGSLEIILRYDFKYKIRAVNPRYF